MIFLNCNCSSTSIREINQELAILTIDAFNHKGENEERVIFWKSEKYFYLGNYHGMLKHGAKVILVKKGAFRYQVKASDGKIGWVETINLKELKK